MGLCDGGEKGGVGRKLRDNFTKTMINIHCIRHRLALVCGDTGDDFKFIRNVEENLIELWNFLRTLRSDYTHTSR